MKALASNTDEYFIGSVITNLITPWLEICLTLLIALFYNFIILANNDL